MATTTLSSQLHPTESPYVHGSVPLTENQALIAQIYGFGGAVVVISFMIYICIYWTFFKPRKLREEREAIANGDIDIEVQAPKKPFKLSARWKPPPIDFAASPPAKLPWWRRTAEPVHNGSFR